MSGEHHNTGIYGPCFDHNTGNVQNIFFLGRGGHPPRVHPSNEHLPMNGSPSTSFDINPSPPQRCRAISYQATESNDAGLFQFLQFDVNNAASHRAPAHVLGDSKCPDRSWPSGSNTTSWHSSKLDGCFNGKIMYVCESHGYIYIYLNASSITLLFVCVYI